MSRRRLAASLFIVIAGALAGCNSDFNDGKTRNIIESANMRLDAEQLVLTTAQVECGVREDLWDRPSDLSPERTTARLTAKGRSLKFDDDVSVKEAGYKLPYVQIRGEFPLQVLEITSTRDGKDQDTKFVEVKLAVKIDHSCFPAPLRLMGLKKGQFSQDTTPVLLFRFNGGWQVDKLVH